MDETHERESNNNMKGVMEARIKDINDELAGMGGSAAFCLLEHGFLPEGYMTKQAFMQRFKEQKESVDALERDTQRVEAENVCLLKQRELCCGLPRDMQRIDQQLAQNARKTAQYDMDANSRKNALMGFLETTQPMADAAAFVARKNALLEEKLGLLVELRLG